MKSVFVCALILLSLTAKAQINLEEAKALRFKAEVTEKLNRAEQKLKNNISSKQGISKDYAYASQTLLNKMAEGRKEFDIRIQAMMTLLTKYESYKIQIKKGNDKDLYKRMLKDIKNEMKAERERFEEAAANYALLDGFLSLPMSIDHHLGKKSYITFLLMVPLAGGAIIGGGLGLFLGFMLDFLCSGDYGESGGLLAIRFRDLTFTGQIKDAQGHVLYDSADEDSELATFYRKELLKNVATTIFSPCSTRSCTFALASDYTTWLSEASEALDSIDNPISGSRDFKTDPVSKSQIKKVLNKAVASIIETKAL